MRALALLLLANSALATERPLTLAEAVDAALRIEPTVAQAKIAEDRSKLAVLRAQLDRVSVKVDGSIQELWNKSNIAGPRLTTPQCTISGAVLPLDSNTCASAGGQYQDVALSQQSPESTTGLVKLSANVQVPLFAGFRIDANVKRAKRLEDAATVNIRQARKDTALAVARAYWQVRRLGLLRDVAKVSVERLSDAERITDARLRAGLSPPIDRNRATVRRLQQEAQVADLDGQLKEASAQLAVALGYAEDLVLTDQPLVPEVPPPSVAELLDEARKSRPEIMSARYQVEAQRQSVRMAMSNYYPQLTTFGLFQVGNAFFNPITGASIPVNSTANPFSNLAGNLTLGLSLNMNFFDTLNTWTATRDARYEEARLWEEKRRQERVVESDVRIAHAKLQHLYERRAPLLALREVARDNLGILEARYKTGDALIIEFLDGQNDLVNAEQQLVDVAAQLETGWLELEAALGRTVGLK
jgi:outer membrane protein